MVSHLAYIQKLGFRLPHRALWYILIKNYRKAAKTVKRPRKVVRPSAEELKELLWQMPTVQIAKKYGVSEKAVEKWAKSYGVEKPPRGYWAKNTCKVVQATTG